MLYSFLNCFVGVAKIMSDLLITLYDNLQVPFPQIKIRSSGTVVVAHW